jgi:hypothetical protein
VRSLRPKAAEQVQATGCRHQSQKMASAPEVGGLPVLWVTLGTVCLSGFGTFAGDRSRVCALRAALAGVIGSAMASLRTIVRCPRCRSRPTVQSAIELRPGVEYLTLRCTSCGLVYDAQVPSERTKSAPREP